MKGKFDKGDLDPSVPAEFYNPGQKDPNYNKNSHKQPTVRMGSGSYANLPEGVIMRDFSRSKDYRSGVVNAFDCGLEEESGIHENRP